MLNDPDHLGPLAGTPTADDLRQGRRALLWGVVRILLVTVFAGAAYFAAPVGQDADVAGIVVLAAGGMGLVWSLVVQVRRIVDSPTPQLRAAEALATTVVLVVVGFSFVYVCMSVPEPAAFSEPMTKVNALYFTVTVLATVGFGDITGESEAARLVVTGQMLIDLLIVGVVVKVLLGASRIGIERRRTEARARGAASPLTEPDHDEPSS